MTAIALQVAKGSCPPPSADFEQISDPLAHKDRTSIRPRPLQEAIVKVVAASRRWCDE